MIYKWFFLLIIFGQLVFAIAVSPGSYLVTDPVAGDLFEFEFYFFREDGGEIFFSSSYEGGALPGEPGFEDERYWLSQIILPEPSSDHEWAAESKKVIVSGVWPDFQVPGERRLYIKGNEPHEGDTGFSAAATVMSRITIRVSYEGVYISPSVVVQNVGEDEDVMLDYNLRNIGDSMNYSGVALFDVYLGDDLIESIYFDFVSNSYQNEQTINLGVFPPGQYEVIAYFEVDNNVWNATDGFIVADDTLNILCNDIVMEPSLDKELITVSSGFIQDTSFSYELLVGEVVVGSGEKLVPALEDYSSDYIFDLINFEDGVYDYSLVFDGDFSCSSMLTIKSAQNNSLPFYVYLGVVLIILIISLASYWYYFRRRSGEGSGGLDF